MEDSTYTFKIYVEDKRTRSGIRLKDEFDYDLKDGETPESYADELYSSSDKISQITFSKTWVKRHNLMTGEEFIERFDTPYYCSPSSEAYFSM